MTINITFSDTIVRVAVEIKGQIESLITELPKRPWVDLTDEEFDELEYRFARYELCRAIGAALRSKNT